MARIGHRTYNFDFASRIPLFAKLSVALTLVSLGLIVYPGPNYGIDFAGGTNIVAEFAEDVTDAEVREAVTAAGFGDASVQSFGAAGGGTFLIEMRETSSLSEEDRTRIRTAITGSLGDETRAQFNETSGDRLYVQVADSAWTDSEGSGSAIPEEEGNEAGELGIQESVRARIASALSEAGIEGATVEPWGPLRDREFSVVVLGIQSVLADHFGETFGERFVAIQRSETVGPRAGAQLRNDGIKAIITALLGILIYIAIRFDFRYAPGAVLSLAHDIILTLGVFVALRIEVTLSILAALLTIVGYSLNDTIINFDRIRENLALQGKKVPIATVVNRSVNEVLTRTLLTSATTVFAVLAIYYLGGGTIRTFAFAMILGVVLGTYSSIFVSNPILIWTSDWMDARAARDPRPAPKNATSGV